MTSKLGLPEASSITAFCRCCCSGICSDSTWMPVRSVNSLMFFCRLSPRGPLARMTSSFVPAYFFQFTSARTGNPERPSAPVAAAPARTERRVASMFFMLFPPKMSAGPVEGGQSLGDYFQTVGCANMLVFLGALFRSILHKVEGHYLDIPRG